MKYQLRQYNYWPEGTLVENFMTMLSANFSIHSGTGSPILYRDTLYYDVDHSYYFAGVIQKKSYVQKINVKLINKDDDQSSANSKMQFIKTIEVPSSTDNDLYFVEFIFKPMVKFDSILFEMESGNNNRRIGCMDLSELNNIIYNNDYLAVPNAGSSLIRFSIQSIPGFLMCLNGEEIRVPRNGIYEVKNGIILINFFTPVAHNKAKTAAFSRWEGAYSNNTPCMNEIVEQEISPSRNYYPFTVDYLYYTLDN